MVEVITEVDGRPLSRFGCDGVVCSTPTGSTAYAFSAGGPVVWPEVEALLMVPISAHALFAPPMLVSPQSVLAVELIVGPETSGAVLWCDGRRKVDLPPGARVEVRRGALPVLLARLETPGARGGRFTDRLVAKFGLPVAGWRGRTWENAGEHA
jgi:NAD+ kinase